MAKKNAKTFIQIEVPELFAGKETELRKKVASIVDEFCCDSYDSQFGDIIDTELRKLAKTPEFKAQLQATIEAELKKQLPAVVKDMVSSISFYN